MDELTKAKLLEKRKEFASRLSLMAVEAMDLGLLQTSHAIRHGEQAPLSVVGYEIADILTHQKPHYADAVAMGGKGK